MTTRRKPISVPADARVGKRPLQSRPKFLVKLARNFAMAFVLVSLSLTVGAAGYHFLENIPWLDAYLNASMILTGMGPVNTLVTDAGKLFAIFYSLFSGVVFLSAFAVLIAPVVHRFLHRFHLDLDETDTES